MNNNQIKITRTQLTENQKYLITKSRAARILGLKENEIEFVYLMPNGKEVLVGLFNSSVKIKLSEFKSSYASERKDRSKGLIPTKRVEVPGTYTVRNQTKQSTYKVQCFEDHIECNCPDYDTSKQVFESVTVACKHIYSVLNEIGVSSLVEYIQRKPLREVLGS
jgi:hypothetical protein